MDQHVIVAGGGRLGRRTAAILADYDHDVTIIEQDSDRCDRLADTGVGVIINGDAARPSILEQARPGEADAFAALTGDGATNLTLCAAVEELTDDIHTLARIDERIEEESLADTVVFPEAAGARSMVDELLGRHARTLQAATGDFDVIEIEVAPGSPVAGKRLREVELPRGSQIISDADRSTVADARTTLRPGERYLVAVEPGVADTVRKLMVA